MAKYHQRAKQIDCSSCPHSVQNNPENEGKVWGDLPCANCDPMNPNTEERTVKAQIHKVEQRSKTTWGTDFLDMGEHALPMSEAARLGRVFRTFEPSFLAEFCESIKGFTGTEVVAFWKFAKGFTASEIKIIAHLAQLGWQSKQCEVAEAAGVSKQAVNNVCKRLAEKYPALKVVLLPNIRRREDGE